jgi:Ca2+/Na+ antiporter
MTEILAWVYLYFFVKTKLKPKDAIKNFVYSQPKNLLHLFGRHNVSTTNAFPWLFPGKLLFMEITLLLYFSAKFSRIFTLSLYFLANDRKPI